MTFFMQHGVSVIIVMVDWGHGHGLFPDEASMGVARHLASLRVTLVLGHHPAAVQGHAYLGETLVVFSMGKVLSSQQVASFCWRPEEVSLRPHLMCCENGCLQPRAEQG